MNTRTPVTFISAESSYNTVEDNQLATLAIVKDFQKHGLKFRVVTGCYKGKLENAFGVDHDSGTAGEEWKILQELAGKYAQESLLHVGADRYGLLYYTDQNKIEGIGRFREVSRKFALSKDAYSFVEGKYYYCGK